ncbi:MAG: PKD domain-containing protein [Bacteroidota bacterium]|jgi:hypothetical protein
MEKINLPSLLLISAALLLNAFISNSASAQAKKKVLFLGNSYTAYNNLPQMVADVALSAGDTVVFSSNTPGGFTLQGHSTNATSLSLLAAGDWDHLVLQEQSQLPSFPQSQVQSSCYPFARALDSIAQSLNPCVKTVFYMTWGRKNGDASNCASWPPVCSYAGMDSLLRLRYMQMASDNDAMVNPVGAVWRHIRNNLPGIELYQTDESHPSLAGSYAAACGFYTAFFRKDPSLIVFDAGLNPVTASQIRQAAKEVVFDSLSTWLVDAYDANASFTSNINGLSVGFQNASINSNSYLWDFGDGNSSTLLNPTHSYASSGTYLVTLTATNCFSTSTDSIILNFSNTGLNEIENTIQLFPNPASDEIRFHTSNQNLLQFELIGIDGQVLGKFDCDIKSVHIQNLPQGTYFIKLLLKDRVVIKSFQKM